MNDFGDMDVLAWDSTKNIVYLIECKDLEVAKTHGEIARQLYDFKGQLNSKGKKDRLLKHVKRLEELEKDIKGIARFTKLNMDLELKALIVFSNVVPMSFDTNRFYKDRVEFIQFEQLGTLQGSS